MKIRESNKLMFSIFFRSFFLQCLWNFERMQNVGFLFGLLPFIKKHYPDPEKRKEVLLRHMEFFNTNPYMANIIFGLIAAMEQTLSLGKSIDPKEISSIKKNTAGPLAAIGDKFFWANWRPFTALLGICFILFFRGSHTFLANWIAPLFFLFFYNIFILFFRFWSLKISYHFRNKTVRVIADLEFRYIIDITRYIGLVLLIVMTISYLYFGLMFMNWIVLALVVMLLSAVIISINLSTEILVYAVILFCILSSYFKVI
ncbi:MAG: PTS system mannose/fructose/sorbose family transporter subunit IID [Elusimicrobia bacterium]|nr:PTS system mannose/fructose/sorbose family transporter subunit IID [Candidatus Liberimonas magnetica]